MDNIQKLILGVLGVAGMIAMLVPSGDPMAPPVASIATVAPTIVEPAAETEFVAEEQSDEESELNDDDVFAMGEPAIDGNPIQSSFQNNSNSTPPASEQYSSPATPSYSQPGIISEPIYSPSVALSPAN